MNLKDYGLKENITDIKEAYYEKNSPYPIIAGRVTAVHKERFEVISELGECSARLKTREYYGGDEEFPTVGDFVLMNYVEGSESQIIKTLKRRSFFSRRDPFPGHGEQAVAANFDYVFIMQSLNLDFNLKRMERYLTLAWQSGAEPVVVLTKKDLVTAEESERFISAAKRVSSGAGVFALSAVSGEGLDDVRKLLKKGTTAVFLGSSGVGKSSLLNALAGEELMAVSGIREKDSRGRHTTTYRQLIMLSCGAMIIDTPGMRVLGMWDVSEGLGEAFEDVEKFIGKCRFADCKHQSEPGCAVKAAIERGELSRERFESYLTLKKEAKYTDAKETYVRRKQERNKEIAKFSRKLKNERKNRYKEDI